MSTIPYQASYSLSSKYGNRYGPSTFAPSTTSLIDNQTMGSQTPAVQTVGAGPANAQEAKSLAFDQDPFAQTATVDGVTTQGVGFIPQQSASTIAYTQPTNQFGFVPTQEAPPVQTQAAVATQAVPQQESEPQPVSYTPTTYSGTFENTPLPGSSFMPSVFGVGLNTIGETQLGIQQGHVEAGTGKAFTSPDGQPVTVHEGPFGGLVITGNTGGVPEQVYFDAYRAEQDKLAQASMDALQSGYEQEAVSIPATPAPVVTADDGFTAPAATRVPDVISAPVAQPAATPSYTVNKQQADEEARSQGGGTSISAVTDTSGKAVRYNDPVTQTSRVVTASSPADDDDSSSGGK